MDIALSVCARVCQGHHTTSQATVAYVCMQLARGEAAYKLFVGCFASFEEQHRHVRVLGQTCRHNSAGTARAYNNVCSGVWCHGYENH